MQEQQNGDSGVTVIEYEQQLPSQKNQLKAILLGLISILLGLIQGLFFTISFLMIMQSAIMIREPHLVLRSLLCSSHGGLLLFVVFLITPNQSFKHYSFAASIISLTLCTTIFFHPLMDIVFRC